MGMTVLTAVVVVRPSHDAPERPSTPGAVEEAPAAPSRPAFLDEPVRGSPTRPDTAPGVPVVPSGTGLARAGVAVPTDTVAPAPSPAGPSARVQSYRAALQSAAVLRPAEGPPPNARSDTEALATEEQQLVSLGDSVLRASTRAGVGSTSAMSPPPRDRSHRRFLDSVGDARGA